MEVQNLITQAEAAKILKVSEAYLERDRCVNGDSPKIPYIKIGRSVRYDPNVLKHVINTNRVGELLPG